MKPQEITQKDVDEKNEYCSRTRLRELMKRSTFDEIIKDDIIMYFTHELGMEPLAWQFKVLQAYNRGARKIACCTSRQIGKTIGAAGIENYRIDYNKGYEDRPTFTNRKKITSECVISRGDDQAKTFLREIKMMRYIGDNNMAEYKNSKGQSVFGKKYVTGKHSKSREGNNMTTITLKKGIHKSEAGSSITSQPPTDVILGKSFSGGILDEVARIEDEIIIENFLPTLKSFGKFIMLISTPLNPEGFFYHRIDPDELHEEHDYERFMFDIDAIKIELPEQWEACQKEIKQMIEDGKESIVMRNYYCSFTSSDELYFPQGRVNDYFDSGLKQMDELVGIPCTLGIDFGGLSKSHTVLTVCTVPTPNRKSERVACWRYPVKKDANIINDIEKNILPYFNIIDMIPEACAAGNISIQQMKAKGWNVHEFATTRISKPDYYDRFRTKLSRGMFKSYPDSELKKEFAAFTDDLKPLKGNTDDMLDSWMLACVPFMNDLNEFKTVVIDNGKDTDKSDMIMLEQEQIKVGKASYLGLARAI